MRAFKLTLAYDGTAYAGWQRQARHLTVQELLEDAIARVTGHRAPTVASGRTDAGVHALGQVVAFHSPSTIPAAALTPALNTCLPADIRVLDSIETSLDFHPIRDARRKRYRYVIHNTAILDVFARTHSWHLITPLNIEGMAAAAARLTGAHDFASFQSSGSPRRSTTRTMHELIVRSEPTPNGRMIQIEMEADGFLYHMARNIAGTLVEVGRGRRDPAGIVSLMAARDRRLAGMTAPAHGLFLVYVQYDGCDH